MQFTPNITAVLGSTNTGKTHYAVERMLARVSGVIGLPLRLLAREIYDKIVGIKGAAACALITGEERIVPPHARFVVCTVEAMPMDDIRAGKFACVIIDEVQMVAHKERGHIFTDRLLYARGTEETLLLGAHTVRPLIEALVPKARFHTRERFSVLSYAGHTKLTRLPKRSVVVAFSAGEVYAIAELMRRAYGGAALVMGALSPRTRNAQAQLYQSGEVDYLVATDAIGMGLNLDADHVAFAALRKFDGQRKRFLSPAEMGQIAGRAGRFRNNGTYGTTGGCLPMDDDDIARIDNHMFEPLRYAEWRNTDLDFTSLDTLQNTLAMKAPQKGLRRIAPAPDEMALSRLLGTHELVGDIKTPAQVKQFWDICQIPDFRNLGSEAHARLLEDIYLGLRENGGQIPGSYLEENITRLGHIEGSVEILSSRLTYIRTWTYIAHKKNWVKSSENWINLARSVEDRLSDALHTKLVARFVDRRTSALLQGIGRNTPMTATIKPTGEVIAENHTIGYLTGLVYAPVASDTKEEAKALSAAAAQVVTPEIDRRLTQIAGAPHETFSLSDEAQIMWAGNQVGALSPGSNLLKPKAALFGGELGTQILKDMAEDRLRDYIQTEIAQKFESLIELGKFAENPEAFKEARYFAGMLFDRHGMLPRAKHFRIINALSPQARGYIRNHGGVFSYYYVFLQDVIKPAPARLISLLYAFVWKKYGGGHKKPFLPPNGLSSAPNDNKYSEASLNMAGYSRRGPRIIRLDILARLHQMIIQANEKFGERKFIIAQEMMSLLGCSYEDFQQVLIALGYESHEVELTPEAFEVEKQRIDFLVLRLRQKQAGVKALEHSPEINDVSDQKMAQPETPPKSVLKKDTLKKKGSQEKTAAISSDETTTKPKAEDKNAADKNTANKDKQKEPKPQKPPLPVGNSFPSNRSKKRKAYSSITDFKVPAAFDDNGDPKYPTTKLVWSRAPIKPKPRRAENPRRRPAADPQMSETALNEDGTPIKRPPRRARAKDKLAGYAAIGKGGKGGKGPLRGKKHTGNKRKTNWTAAPKPKTQESQQADSPFAALSALKLDNKKD